MRADAFLIFVRHTTFERGAIAVNRAIEAGHAYEFVGGYSEKGFARSSFLRAKIWLVYYWTSRYDAKSNGISDAALYVVV